MRTQPDGHLRVKPVAAGSRQSVFVFEFGEVGTTRRLSESLAKGGDDSAIYAIDPVADIARLPGYVVLPELAERYAGMVAGLHQDGPLVVVGYCSASVLALRVAELLRADQTVRTVLVQPTKPDLPLIRGEYARIRQSLAVAEADAAVSLDEADAPPDLYHRLDQALARDEAAWAVGRGVSGTSPALAFMASRHRAWLSVLLSSHEAVASTRCPDDALVVESAEQPGDWPDRSGGPRRVFPPDAEADPLDNAELTELVLNGHHS
ncbi:hypothetical protein [Streptomyces puniciscabiei]|uniref:hypothetical protein n=1 Tax=Streptomyces puniciscabiei TaxID=164348 RepID=UPI00332C2FB2